VFRWKQLVLAGNPATDEVRRFLTGPVGYEITGLALTPVGRTRPPWRSARRTGSVIGT